MLNIITNIQIGCNNIITDINNTIVSEHYNISNNDGKITILVCVDKEETDKTENARIIIKVNM